MSEAFRRLDKKEDRIVEEKWMPIMAERRREAETEAEGEDQYVEGQLPGSSEGRQEEGKDLDGRIKIIPPIVEVLRNAVPVLYVANDPREDSEKRKRADLDEIQEPNRQSTFVPQALELSLAQTARTTEKSVLSRSASPHCQLPPPASVPVPKEHARQGVTRSPTLKHLQSQKASTGQVALFLHPRVSAETLESRTTGVRRLQSYLN